VGASLATLAAGAASNVADEYLLDRGRVGLRELDRQIARGLLGTPRRAKAFRTVLRDFGYR
jgi:hypothetical protein